jgi:alpha-ribazole phosphatase
MIQLRLYRHPPVRFSPRNSENSQNSQNSLVSPDFPASPNSGICYGRTDPDLDPAAFAEWKDSTVKFLSKDTLFSGSTVWSSPSIRCAKAAQFLSETMSLPVPRIHPGLSEIDFGDWENRTWDELYEDTGSGFREWSDRWWELSIPGGESFSGFQRRVLNSFQEILLSAAASEFQSVEIVSHAGPIRVLISHIENRATEDLFKIKILPGSIHTLNLDPMVPLTSADTISHTLIYP